MRHRQQHSELIPGDGIAMRPFTASLPMALLQAREATMRQFRPMLADFDLTEQQWRVLRALSASDEPMTVGDVAEKTFLHGPSVSRIAANLYDRGLILRTTAPDDQRRHNLSLAKPGRTVVQTVAPYSEHTYNEIEEAFGQHRLQALLKELHDLANAISLELPAPDGYQRDSP